MNTLDMYYSQLNDEDDRCIHVTATTYCDLPDNDYKDAFYRASMSRLMHRYGLLRPGNENTRINDEPFNVGFRYTKESYLDGFNYIDENMQLNSDVTEINLGEIEESRVEYYLSKLTEF